MGELLSAEGLVSKLRWLRRGCVVACAAGFWIANLWAGGALTNVTESAFLNLLKSGGLISLEGDGALTFTNTLRINIDTEINASNHSVSISGGGAVRIFNVQTNARLTLVHLTLMNGQFAGVDGTNAADGQTATGAALFNDGGTVVASDCDFSNNAAIGGAGGNGFLAADLLSTTKSHPDAGAGGAALGAAIFNAGNLTLSNCTFSGNTLTAGKGGTGAAGLLFGNGGDGGRGGAGGWALGGAVYNGAGGALLVVNCSFYTNNAAAGDAGLGGAGTGLLGFPGKNGSAGFASGGAIYNDGGQVAVAGSTLAGNAATGGAGMPGANGIAQENGDPGDPGGAAFGGAIRNSGQLLVANCTFFGNILIGGSGGAGGAGDGSGFGADGGRGGDGGLVEGGAICNFNPGATRVVSSTFSQNSVRGGAGGAGGAASGALGRDGPAGKTGAALGAALFTDNDQAAFKNTILAASLMGANVSGPALDGGFNLDFDSSLTVFRTGSVNGVDPLLGALTNNGGPTLTMAISSNSPAADAITAPDENGSPPTDQRGALRNAPFDIGAYELNGVFPGPRLLALAQTNQLLLSWTNPDPTLNLEAATNVPSANWTPVATPPTLLSNMSQMLLPIVTNQPRRFFRLRGQ